MRCVVRYGQAKTSLSDVATEVGVTRATIYRYFDGHAALLAEAGLATADDFLRRLDEQVAGIDDPATALVEAAAFAIEELPGDRFAPMWLAAGPQGLAAEILTSGARAAGQGVLDRLGFDWDELLVGSISRDQLIELLLRLIHSFVLDPGDPPSSGDELRTFLRSWVALALAA